MDSAEKWLLTDSEKGEFIAALTPNLPALRTQAEISQEELANLIGVSRQTYSAIERKIRRMSWSTYLSLVLFFDHNQKTHKMLRMLSIFPKKLITQFNDGIDYSSYELSSLLGEQSQDIIERLDQQALRSIRSMIMVEYARCTQLPSEAIIKSFGGLNFVPPILEDHEIEAAKALRSIKREHENDAQ